MLFQLFFTIIFSVILRAASENEQLLTHIHGKDVKHKGLQKIHNTINPSIHVNKTYIDRAVNILKMPNLPKNIEYHKNTRKISKKSPKRTIQKIIKRNMSKKKIYINQVQSTTNKPIVRDDLDKYYAQEVIVQKNESLPTIQVNQNKKYKWNSNPRYPIPFQKLQSMREHKRNRRSDQMENERQDLYIFTDLDEMEFLNNDKDKDVIVNAHVKKYYQ